MTDPVEEHWPQLPALKRFLDHLEGRPIEITVKSSTTTNAWSWYARLRQRQHEERL